MDYREIVEGVLEESRRSYEYEMVDDEDDDYQSMKVWTEHNGHTYGVETPLKGDEELVRMTLEKDVRRTDQIINSIEE